MYNDTDFLDPKDWPWSCLVGNIPKFISCKFKKGRYHCQRDRGKIIIDLFLFKSFALRVNHVQLSQSFCSLLPFYKLKSIFLMTFNSKFQGYFLQKLWKNKNLLSCRISVLAFYQNYVISIMLDSGFASFWKEKIFVVFAYMYNLLTESVKLFGLQLIILFSSFINKNASSERNIIPHKNSTKQYEKCPDSFYVSSVSYGIDYTNTWTQLVYFAFL